VPEWYFWPFYAILRAFTVDVWFIPAKLLGVLAMFAAIIVLFFLPWLDTSRVKSTTYRPLYRIWFWVFVANIIVLSYVGGAPAEEPYVIISQITSAYYFAHFLIVLPIVSAIERPLPLPRSITEHVLATSKNKGHAGGAPAGMKSGPAEVAAQPAE
jgi:ubiquinol-cytochrome c reductase cytochrome b subunit